MQWLIIALGGAFGAVSRAFISAQVAKALGATFPFGTLLVNVVGSFLMGLCFVIIVEQLKMPSHWRELIMVGFLGAFTTFSTFSLESLSMLQHGQWHMALLYMLTSLTGCVLACYCGWAIAKWLI